MTGKGYRLGERTDGECWRCPVCTLTNSLKRTSCARCTEPLTEEERNSAIVKGMKSKKIGGRSPLLRPEAGKQSVKKEIVTQHKPKAKAPSPGVSQKPPTTKPVRSSAGAPVRSYRRTGALSPLDMSGRSRTSSTISSASSRRNRSGPPSSRRQKRRSVPNSKEKIRSRIPKAKSSVKQDYRKMSKKQLGYKPKTSANIYKPVRSRLHRDTASYRGKFDAKPLAGKKCNIATIGDLTSKSGWQTSINFKKLAKDSIKAKRQKKKAALRPRHSWEERAFTPPPEPKKDKDGRPLGTIAKLQAAASGVSMASLKHTKRYVPRSKKSLGSGVSKYEM